LSLGGFAFAADRSVDPGEQLSIHVEAPEVPGGLDFLAETVRCAPSPGREGSWEISVRFLPPGRAKRRGRRSRNSSTRARSEGRAVVETRNQPKTAKGVDRSRLPRVDGARFKGRRNAPARAIRN
jgi:hypothetical protein